jgi:hypothetical protein
MRAWFTLDLMPPGDFMGYAAVIAYVRDALLRYGRVPMWCSTCFGGTTYFVSSFKEYLAFPFAVGLGPALGTKAMFLLMKVLAASGMYLLHARLFGAPLAGLVAGYAYGFGACANHETEHLDVPVSQVLFPLIFLAATGMLRERHAKWAVALGFLLACQLWNNMVQASVCVPMVALLAAVRPWREAPGKETPPSGSQSRVGLLLLVLLVFALVGGAHVAWLAADGGNHYLISPEESASGRLLYIERSPFLFLNRANWMARWLAGHQPPGLDIVTIDGERRYLGVVALAVCLAGWFCVRARHSLRRWYQVGALLFLVQYWLALGPRTVLWQVARSFGWSGVLEGWVRIALTVGATASLAGALLLFVRDLAQRKSAGSFRVELLLGLALALLFPAYPLYELVRNGIPLAGRFFDLQRSPGHYFDVAPFSLYLVFGLSLAAIGDMVRHATTDRRARRPDPRARRRAPGAKAPSRWVSIVADPSWIPVTMIGVLLVADFWPSTEAFRQGTPMESMRRAAQLLADLPGEDGTLRIVWRPSFPPIESWLTTSSQAGPAWSWLFWQAGRYWVPYLNAAAWRSGGGPTGDPGNAALPAIGRLKYFTTLGKDAPAPWTQRAVYQNFAVWEQPEVVPMASGYRSYVAFVGGPDEAALNLIPPLFGRNTLVVSPEARLSEVGPELIDAATFVHVEGKEALSDEASRDLAARHPEKVGLGSLDGGLAGPAARAGRV